MIGISFTDSWCGAGRLTQIAFTLLAGALLGSITQVQAVPITYSLTTTATGTLGGSPFTNALVTVTLTGDTANVVPGPIPFNNDLFNTGNATVSIAGLGTVTFTDPIVILSTFNDLTLFGVPAVVILDGPGSAGGGTGILDQFGLSFSGYALGPLGPVSGTGGVASGSSTTPIFPTTAGPMTWAIGQPNGNSTFVAAATPEPGSLFLFGSGLVTVFARRRYKGRSRSDSPAARA